MINRQNYETYFLMYVDNELTAGERVAVEDFAAANPDLASELEILKQATMNPGAEAYVFEAKHLLLKSINEINAENYEEYFLHYIDNELSAEQRAEVELFVLQHPQLQQQFTLLKETVLPQETLVFKNKEELLRREDRRVIPLFVRLAVAAAVIGIAVVIWWLVPAQHATQSTGVAQVKKEQPVKDAGTQNSLADQNTAATQPQKDEAGVKIGEKNEVAATGDKPAEKKVQEIKIAPSPLKAERPAPYIAKADAPVNRNNSNNNGTQNNNYASTKITGVKPGQENAVIGHDNTQSVNNSADINTTIAKTNTNTQNQSEDNSQSTMPVQAVAYKELDTHVDEEQGTVYVGALGLNKNKVRGFVKKIGGMFSARSKNATDIEDGKLQVANLQINTN